MTRTLYKTPIWIILENLFEGHQGHFADCYFSNATESLIREFAKAEGVKIEIRPMTKEELNRWPEAAGFSAALKKEYGE
jgi:hypothetical protein